jgi:hypothetical protein
MIRASRASRASRFSVAALSSFAGVTCLGLALAFAGTPRGYASNPDGGTQATVDASAPVQELGHPVCIRVGTRSEGWAWPSGRFIHWGKCKGVVPTCHAVDARHAVEGWYAKGGLIAAARCPKKR